MAGALLLVMWQGLLPGLLSVCLGFLLTRWLAPRLQWLQRGPNSHLGQTVAATLVVGVPLLLLALALSRSRSYVIEAPQQYRELLDFMARTVLELRHKLPPTSPRSCLKVRRRSSASLRVTWAPRPAHSPTWAVPGWAACYTPMWAC